MNSRVNFLRLRTFFARHPIVRDAVRWAVPALICGAVLRMLLVSYLPYAFWGADSRSYYSFAHLLIERHLVSLDEKRRYLYPILMVPVTLLPGVPLRWIAVLQHALGVATLVPLAYVVRKTLVHWRLWIVPVTVLYSALPVMVWYEHELLGENVFFAALMWAFAGWVAWVSEARLERSRRLFWWFFIPFAAFVLTKPSGRFAWPGLVFGLVLVGAWHRLDRPRIIALLALAGVTLTVGSKKQGAWLLYTATFPLTQLDSPRHAEYKAEIRDLVEPLRRHPGLYYFQDDGPFAFLRNPGAQDDRPRWKALEKDARKKSALYMDLALEGIKAEPVKFAEFGFQRMVASANLSNFSLDRFTGENFRQRTEHFYAEGQRDKSNRVRLAFGLPDHGAIPPYAEFRERLNPMAGSWCEKVVLGCMRAVCDSIDLVRMPGGPKSERTIARARPTSLGWWLLGAAALSFLPAYRRTFGVWTLVAAGNLAGIFLVSQANPRYFAPAWVVILPLLAVAADVFMVEIFTKQGVGAARTRVSESK